MPSDTGDLSFLEHLDQLRTVLIRIFAVFFICCVPCWFLSQKSLDLLLRYAAPADFPLHYFSLMEPFITRLKITGFLALAITLPWTARCIWHFLEPGLLEDERRSVLTASCAMWLLALAGAALAFFFIVPALINFSLSFSGPSMQPVIGIGDFTGLVLAVLLAAMALFQFPVVLYLLLRTGLIRLSYLRAKRAHVIVLIFILAAVFSPPDVFSQLLLAIPSWLLFEASLFYFSKHNTGTESSCDAVYRDADKSGFPSTQGDFHEQT